MPLIVYLLDVVRAKYTSPGGDELTPPTPYGDSGYGQGSYGNAPYGD